MNQPTCGYYVVLDKNGNQTAITIFDDNFAIGFPTLVRIGDAPCVHLQNQQKAVVVNTKN
jgi:hypothetical protein